MMIATASSEAVSVSIRNERGTRKDTRAGLGFPANLVLRVRRNVTAFGVSEN
jgi:hypothetical protein